MINEFFAIMTIKSIQILISVYLTCAILLSVLLLFQLNFLYLVPSKFKNETCCLMDDSSTNLNNLKIDVIDQHNKTRLVRSSK